MPFSKEPSEITPTEFEKEVLNFFQDEPFNFKIIEVVHDKNLRIRAQNYQIDVYFEHEAHGLRYKTLVECKRHKGSIKREVIQVLYNKVQETGSNKGVLVSASDFQTGAIEFAKEKGIALIRILNGEQLIELKSAGKSHVDLKDYRKYFGIPDFGLREIRIDDDGGISFTSLEGQYKLNLYNWFFEKS